MKQRCGNNEFSCRCAFSLRVLSFGDGAGQCMVSRLVSDSVWPWQSKLVTMLWLLMVCNHNRA
jgi:hypothetical protein